MASLWAWPNNKKQLIRSTTAVLDILEVGVTGGWGLGWLEQEGVRAFGL